jgi:hypothetical protein
MAQFNSIVTMDADFRKYYWLLVCDVAQARAHANSGQFLTADDFSTERVLRFVAERDHATAARLMVKYIAPVGATSSPKEKKKADKKVPLEVLVQPISAVALKDTPAVAEAEFTVDDYMEVVDQARRREVKPKVSSNIAAMNPVKLPISAESLSGFRSVFPGPATFGALDRSLHASADCGICAGIGPRIAPRQIKAGAKTITKRVLLCHEKVYALAAHDLFSVVDSPSAAGLANSRLAVGTHALLQSYDPALNKVEVKSAGWDQEGEAKKGYHDLVRYFYSVGTEEKVLGVTDRDFPALA